MQKYFLFVSSFEHLKFAIDKKNFKKHYDNPNYYAFTQMIFQTYKNVIFEECPLT